MDPRGYFKPVRNAILTFLFILLMILVFSRCAQQEIEPNGLEVFLEVTTRWSMNSNLEPPFIEINYPEQVAFWWPSIRMLAIIENQASDGSLSEMFSSQKWTLVVLTILDESKEDQLEDFKQYLLKEFKKYQQKRDRLFKLEEKSPWQEDAGQ